MAEAGCGWKEGGLGGHGVCSGLQDMVPMSYRAQMVSRVVIDSNRLQSDELRVFLSLTCDNYAVLTDYAWMEAYKGAAHAVSRVDSAYGDRNVVCACPPIEEYIT